jgi:NAD(P)-dependent dehydrogenase (short-subunit alcohol dehydrogenase family)
LGCRRQLTQHQASEQTDVVNVAGDISDPATARNVIDTAVLEFGRVDTLVNNAGIFIAKPFTDYSPGDYQTLIGVNLTGFVATTQLEHAPFITGEILLIDGGQSAGH